MDEDLAGLEIQAVTSLLADLSPDVRAGFDLRTQEHFLDDGNRDCRFHAPQGALLPALLDPCCEGRIRQAMLAAEGNSGEAAFVEGLEDRGTLLRPDGRHGSACHPGCQN